MRQLQHPYSLLITATLFWAGNAIAGKLAAGHVSPMLLTLMRWTAAALVIAPFAWTDLRREWPLLRPHLGMMFCLGAVGFGAFNALLYLSLNYTTAINVTIEQSAMPLVVLIGNWLFFRVRFTVLQIIGFLLTLAGVVLTVSRGSLSTLLTLDLNRGDALMMLAVFFYGGYTLALRFKPALRWRSTILVLSASAALACIPFTFIEWAAGHFRAPDMRAWLVVLYAAVFPSLASQSLYIRGVDLLGPNRANLFINLVPVFGSLLAVSLLGETLHPYHMAALVLVVGGIWLAERGAANATPS